MQKELHGWFAEISYLIRLLSVLAEFGAISSIIGISIYTGLFRWLSTHGLMSKLFVNVNIGFSVVVGLGIFGLFVRLFIPFKKRIWKQVQKKYDLRLLRNTQAYPAFFEILNRVLQFTHLEMPVIYIMVEDLPNCFTWRINHQQILVVTTGLATTSDSTLVFRMLLKQCLDLKLHYSQLRVLSNVVTNYLMVFVLVLDFIIVGGVLNSLWPITSSGMNMPSIVLHLSIFIFLGWFFFFLFGGVLSTFIFQHMIVSYCKTHGDLHARDYLNTWFWFERRATVMIDYSVFDYMINQLWSNCLDNGIFSRN